MIYRWGIAALVLCCSLGLAAQSQIDIKRERNGKSDAAKDAMEGKAPPPMAFDGWANIAKEPKDWASLKGSVVLIDFWAHWCGPCRASVPKINELHEKFKSKGLVIVAVHSDPNTEKGKSAITETSMAYPVAFDTKGALMKALGCDSYPDYVLIDRKGIIRAVDVANADVPRAVEALVNEK
jgi:thiol-disulfide isomerase/thioredoxin